MVSWCSQRQWPAIVTATGVFRAHHLTEKQAIGWLTHLAAERGEVFDPQLHNGELTVFQLEGSSILE